VSWWTVISYWKGARAGGNFAFSVVFEDRRLASRSWQEIKKAHCIAASAFVELLIIWVTCG
jgi:hypothetical protein